MTGIFQVLLLVSATLASEPSCPACSKYDYEEKMLERMIRMDFAFEKLDEKLEQNLSKIKEEKAHLHELIVDDLTDQQKPAEQQALIPAVYFQARSPQTSSLTTGEVIVYKTEETNQGNGYSATTGKFTAPVKGLYMFFMHTCTNSHKFAFLQLVKDGLNLIANEKHATSGVTCSSSQVFVKLDIGEKVWVQCSGGASTVQLYHSQAYSWTSFGGDLIHN
ncbi:complement C1q-like protein 4 [Mya arenaria]|uniref:complement C1q-like protein 4 n=1 Tax=Mya arenaria TaxID=6604 RepID=UPI0022DF3F29|nr:complement C1q-like protein 4 [Mya arenaria]